MSTAPVFYAASQLQPAFSELTVGARARLSGREGHHGADVKRLRAGEIVDLVDGKGQRARAQVSRVGRGEFEVQIISLSRDAVAAHTPRIHLVQALAKGGRDEQAVEAAIELGAHEITPWLANRCIATWRGPKAEKGREKWAALALAAMKQSRRSELPEVHSAATSAGLAKQIAAATAGGETVLVLHESATEPIRAAVNAPKGSKLWVIVGPEGGISEQELESFNAAGAQTVRLGPHVTRSSSAGPAAIALIGGLTGLWELDLPPEQGADHIE